MQNDTGIVSSLSYGVELSQTIMETVISGSGVLNVTGIVMLDSEEKKRPDFPFLCS